MHHKCTSFLLCFKPHYYVHTELLETWQQLFLSTCSRGAHSQRLESNLKEGCTSESYNVLFQCKHFVSVCVVNVNALQRLSVCLIKSVAPSAGQANIGQERETCRRKYIMFFQWFMFLSPYLFKPATLQHNFLYMTKHAQKCFQKYTENIHPLLLSTYKASDNILSAFQNITII